MSKRRRTTVQVPISWGDQIKQSREYVATLEPAARLRAVRNKIFVSCRSEETEAYLKGSTLGSGFSEDDYETALGELLDGGFVRATVIDGGREFGFLPGIVREACTAERYLSHFRRS